MIKDISLALMTGADILIPECCLIMHQPTIYEISQMGETNFFAGSQILCFDKKALLLLQNDNAELRATIDKLSNFEILSQTLTEAPEKKEMVKDILLLLFPQYKIILTPRTFSFVKENETYTVDKDNFMFLQEAIGKILCLSKTDEQAFNPGSKQAEEISKKLLRARQRVAAQKKKDEGSGSSLGQYISVITVGIPSMSLADTMQLTVFQMYDLVSRLNLYIAWDIDLRARLAGGKPDQRPDNWMKKLY